MPTFHIYRGGRQIASQDFNYHFFILKNLQNEISWKADGETGGNEILVWIKSNYTVSGIRPDLQLIIDNVPLAQKVYEYVELEGKNVIFKYRDYEFMCQFPEIDEQGI
jgi:hypothetical protein